MSSDRMFQVIVLGGIALAGGACGGRVVVDGNASAGVGGFGGFGSTTNTFQGPAATVGSGGFPNEGPATTVGAGGFPNEGPIQDAGVDGFPTEADPPPPFDAGDDSGFPNETAVPPP